LANDGYDTAWIRSIPVPFIALSIEIVGLFCMVRVFSMTTWPSWIWAVSMAATIAVMAALAWGG